MTLNKATKAEFKLSKDADNQPTGVVEFYASVFDNIDLTGDRVVKGAFANSLNAWRKSGDPIPVIFSHDWTNPFAMIGSADPSEVIEDDHGLLVKAQLDIDDNPLAKQVWRNMSRKTLNQSSFAYDVVQESGMKKGRDGANDLLELNLLEVGPCLLGANPATAGVLSAKSRSSARKDAPMDGSVEQAQAAVVQAVIDYFGSMPGADPDDFYVSPYATFSNHIIVQVSDFSDGYSTRYFDFPYTVDADSGEVTLTMATEVQVETQISPVSKSADADGTKAADSDSSEDRAQTLFDLSDAAHTAIAVAIVFGAQDVRNGKPKPQSEWTYRGGNPGADLTAAQVATVVSRVRAAADKFSISLTAPDDSKSQEPDGSKSVEPDHAKAGSRNSAADQKAIQSIHDNAAALGATCTAEKSSAPDGTKDSTSPGIPIGTVETPDNAEDGVNVPLAEDDDDAVRIGQADDGNSIYAPASVLAQINMATEAHQSSDDGDTDPSVDGDGVDSTEAREDAKSDEEPATKSVDETDYSLSLLDLESFTF